MMLAQRRTKGEYNTVAFDVACFDRLRVLTTELKRLAAAGAPVALRFGSEPALVDTRLAAALWWV
jgi:hypothetical protein